MARGLLPIAYLAALVLSAAATTGLAFHLWRKPERVGAHGMIAAAAQCVMHAAFFVGGLAIGDHNMARLAGGATASFLWLGWVSRRLSEGSR